MAIKDLGTIQLNLLDLAKNYLNKKSTANNPFYYINLWCPDSLGSLNFECIQKKGIYAHIKKYFRLIKGIAEARCIYTYNFDSNLNHNFYNCIVISWCKKENFSDNGSFNCPYYGVNSKESPNNLIWLLVSLDDFIPDNVQSNVYIFYKKYEGNPLKEIIKNLCCGLKEGFLPITQVFFLKNFATTFQTKLMRPSVKSILIPYEAQPWQNALYESAKKVSTTVKTVGYVHSSLPSLPTDYIRRKGAPDILLVHGKGQKDILHKHLGWNKKSIKVIDSMRYKKKNYTGLQNKIFIPYGIFNAGNYLKSFEEILKNKKISLPRLSIKNHPIKGNSLKHLKLISSIEKLLANYENSFSIDTNISVVFGITTCVLDCLSQGISVLHIVDNPIYESYSNEIWTGINVTRLDENAFLYYQEDKDFYLQITDRPVFQEEILNYV